jgi:serine/threonine protein kinase
MILTSNKVYKTYREAAQGLSGHPYPVKVQGIGLENRAIFTIGNRVLKFTFSARDAKASERLIGKNFRNVVRIYSVNRVCLQDEDGKFYVYAIEQEKLHRDRHIRFHNLDVERIVLTNPNRSLSFLKSVVNDVLNAYVELRSVGIIYRDLHSNNILRDTAGNLKLIDFGFATIRRKSNQSTLR